jgi:hypothetical protein
MIIPKAVRLGKILGKFGALHNGGDGGDKTVFVSTAKGFRVATRGLQTRVRRWVRLLVSADTP